MTGADRIEAAFSREGTDAFAAVIDYEGIFLRDHTGAFRGCPWWYAYSPDVAHRLAFHRVVSEEGGYDWYAVPGVAPCSERGHLRVETCGDEAFVVDECSGERTAIERPVVGGDPRYTADYAAGRWAPQPRTRDEVDAALPPPEPFDAQAFAREGCCDLADACRRDPAQGRYPIAHIGSPLWGCVQLWGFEGLMVRVAEGPELVTYASQRQLEHAFTVISRAVALGAKAVWVEECMTDMISPAAFAALNLPHVRRLVGAVRDAGLRSIYYYCGNPNDRLDLLLAAGADALSLEEGKKGFSVDIARVAEYVDGRCVLLGNLDAIGVLQDGADALLAAEVARQLAAGRRNRGRFVMSLGSPVTPSTPVARVKQYAELVHEARGWDGRGVRA